MDTVNERLREAAMKGHEVEIQALLPEPQCDPLSRDRYGLTALMWAAWHGRASCVELLLPVSDAAVRDFQGKNANELATDRGYPEIASLIEAYTLSMSEVTSIRSSTGPGIHRPKSLPRL